MQAKRRRRRAVRMVCVTHNSEYYLEGGRCVAVRDRATGEFAKKHRALNQRLSGAIVYRDGDVVLCSIPMNGDHLVFEGGVAVTSEIIDVRTERYRLAS
jgi:hypothetical protein